MISLVCSWGTELVAVQYNSKLDNMTHAPGESQVPSRKKTPIF